MDDKGKISALSAYVQANSITELQLVYSLDSSVQAYFKPLGIWSLNRARIIELWGNPIKVQDYERFKAMDSRKEKVFDLEFRFSPIGTINSYRIRGAGIEWIDWKSVKA